MEKKAMQEKKNTALAGITRTMVLTRKHAVDIVDHLWGEAPFIEKEKAAMLCVDYGLNPLAKHLFLIPYNRKDGGKDWAIVMGIKAKRLIAYRQGRFSYADMTPRLMTNEEQKSYFGGISDAHISAITIIVDGAGNRYPGYGRYSLSENPKGMDKGNTRENMAMIRSESAALERYAPGAMPDNIDVIDADYEDIPDVGLVSRSTGEIVVNKPVIESKPVMIESKPEKKEPETIQPAHKDVVDRVWIKESLKSLNWRNVIHDYLSKSCWLIDKAETVTQYLDAMTEKEQREFEAEIQRRLKEAGK
jgi:hypothetical protein